MKKKNYGEYSDTTWKRLCEKDYTKIIGNEVLARKFEAKVEKTETCWIWKGPIINNGTTRRYGCMTCVYGAGTHGGRIRAHRLSYLLYKGDIPDGMVIDHLCENKLCVNPDHLEAVDTRENVQRFFNGRCCDDCTAKITAIRQECMLKHRK